MLINRPHKERKPKPWPSDKPKPKLPSRQLVQYAVHYSDLEDYLYQVYRMHFNFHQAIGLKKGTLLYEVVAKPELPDGWGMERVADQIRLGRYTRSVQYIMNVLCIDGFIPAGIYVIDTRVRPSAIAEYRSLIYTTENPLDPQCIAFKDKHRSNRDFIEAAKRLDKSVLEWLKNNQEHQA
jgi:hypothetical protein